MDMEDINKRLRALRLKRGLTMKQVAETAQIPLSTYREWEYGRAIQGEPYLQLAEALSVSLGELITGKDNLSEAWRELAKIEEHVKNLKHVLSSSL